MERIKQAVAINTYQINIDHKVHHSMTNCNLLSRRLQVYSNFTINLENYTHLHPHTK